MNGNTVICVVTISILVGFMFFISMLSSCEHKNIYLKCLEKNSTSEVCTPLIQ